MANEENGEMVSAVQAAKMLGVSRQTIYRMATEGRIRHTERNPALKRNRTRYSLADVERIKREGRGEATP